MSNISFSEDAWEDYLYWQLQDKKTLKKINELLKEIQRTPFSGKGEPEKLRGDLNGKWSRRINLKDRLVYEISDETIIVIQCKGHYSDILSKSHSFTTFFCVFNSTAERFGDQLDCF